MDAETLAWIVASGMGTALGGLCLFAVRRPSDTVLAALLGFTAGVMLAATSFSLLVPALERGSVAEVLAGFALGAVALLVLDHVVPHAHAGHREGETQTVADQDAGRRAALLLSALTIHNIPEGLAVGLAFAAGGPELGIPLALAIGIQNVPEGFAAAAPLVALGTRLRTAAGVAALTGAVEPPAAIAAYSAAQAAAAVLPAGLGFAAGAMLYVIADELIPESHSGGHERAATVALLAGFALMLVLDNTFG